MAHCNIPGGNDVEVATIDASLAFALMVNMISSHDIPAAEHGTQLRAQHLQQS